MIEQSALFSDGTKNYVSPMEADPGEVVTIRFRCARNNLHQVWLHLGDAEIEMTKEEPARGFDYYRAEITLGSDPLRYCFRIRQDAETLYFTRTGCKGQPEEADLFSVLPGFHTPDWAKGAVMYQIFTDRFRNGDPSNDVLPGEYRYLQKPVTHAKSWAQIPDGSIDVGNFYGGDLQGVLEKLDDLQELGVEVLYFNPLFVSPSNHKYDAQDYDHIDPHFGTIVRDEGALLSEKEKENTAASRYRCRVTDPANLEASDVLFVKLVEEAHARGMRVILDGVFNHCGSFHKWMDREGIYRGCEGYAKGAFVSEDSPYRDFFSFREGGKWPDNKEYDGWWDHPTLPKLNYEGSHRLQEEVLRIARKWVSPPYNADGWRLDVAADLGHSEEFNHAFWRRFRKEVKKANPEALILAEHYGDPSPWLAGDQWDTVMNYDAFMEPVTWFLTGMEKHSEFFSEERYGDAAFFSASMQEGNRALPMSALLTAMNELDNHDHSRFLTRTNQTAGRVEQLGTAAAEQGVDKAVLREAVVLQMTWPGAPTLYYGDEAGVCGFTDPDSRRPYPWGAEDKELRRFYKEAIALHNKYPVLRTGSLRLLYTDRHVLGYARFEKENGILVFLNNRKETYELHAEVWPAGLSREDAQKLRLLLQTTAEGFVAKETEQTVEGGWLHGTLPPCSATVFGF